MAEFTANAIQVVQPSQAVVFASSSGFWGFPFNLRQGIFHQGESSTITLRGIVNNPYKELALYQATFNGNIAVPTGATVGEIAIGIARNGEVIQTSKAIVTPAAVEDYFNVTSTAFIIVPRGMQVDISVENASVSATPATTPAPPINVQNANLVVQRIA